MDRRTGPLLKLLVGAKTPLNHFILSICNNSAMIAWCTDQEMDIYEVFSEEDFNNCNNLSENPTHYSKDYEIEGFVIRPTNATRYFVSKMMCGDGFKVKVTFTPDCQFVN